MPDFDEPKAIVADLLSEVLQYVKASRPTRTDGSSTSGYVYSVMRPGQMISPRDFGRPWSPVGGTSSTTPATPPPPAPAPAAGGTTDPAAAAAAAAALAAATKAATLRAEQAVLNTIETVDTMLVVTNDGTMETYSGGGRHLAVTYAEILQAMEALPLPPRSAEDTDRINKARAVLWDANQDPTPAYAKYLSNQSAVALAKAQYALNSNKYASDPASADIAPQLLEPYQTKVDQAYHQWKAQGADEIEAALAIVESLGIPLEQGMIELARQKVANWSFALGAVADKMPYSYVLPSDWALTDVDDIGWTEYTRDTQSVQSAYTANGYHVNDGQWSGQSESTSGSAGLSICGIGASGDYSEQHSSDQSSGHQADGQSDHYSNQVKGVSIKLEYGLCQVARPWALMDVFRMKHWFLSGQKAKCISDGTIDGQVGNEDQLLPMLPTHFLAIRNVEISATEWGETKDFLSQSWGSEQSQGSQQSSGGGASVSVPVFGPLCVTGGVRHGSSSYQGSFDDESGNHRSDDYGSYFDGETLHIKGTQIVAWLSEVVPASPPIDDPALSAPASVTLPASTTPASTTPATTTPATTPAPVPA